MLRLVQGDVGSGKTIIALLAMLHVVECNNQAAMLAPTEILARQHFKTISALCAPLNVRVELLVSQMKRSERQRILAILKLVRLPSSLARMLCSVTMFTFTNWALPLLMNNIALA